MASRLTAEQLESYQEVGYLIYDQPVFSHARFTALKEHCEARMAAWEEALGHPLQTIDRSHFIDPKLNQWLLADEVLDLVEPIIGPDIALFASSFMTKSATVVRRAPWHEDASYWGKLAHPVEACSVWLAIDPSVSENGCMQVIPGSHRQRHREHVYLSDASGSLLSREVKPGSFDESEAVDCILDPNTCSLHDAYLLHGSNANNGTMRRCGFQMRYMPTTVKSKSYKGHCMYLARGKDRAGNEYGDPDKVNEEFLAANPGQRPLAQIARELG
jgi:ectoine hydroxylase-related dioxygenase (phytanoyl-CoA dioxygenase family)